MLAVQDRLRFLVVDDDADVRDLMARYVERLGHSAECARDGVEAIEALALDRYDFMLLDLTMPRMSGEDVLRWLRSHPQWSRGLRVIVASARTTGLDADDLGADAVLAKPFRLEELKRTVAALGPSPAVV